MRKLTTALAILLFLVSWQPSVAQSPGVQFPTPANPNYKAGGAAILVPWATDGDTYQVGPPTAAHPVPVTGTFTVPSGAALDASLQSILTKLNGSLAVTGTFWQATQPVNVTQYGGSSLATGAGASGAGVPRVTVANDASNDPCQNNVKSYGTIGSSNSVRIITGVSGKKTYICSLVIVSSAANAVALIEGTGTTCGTSTLSTILGAGNFLQLAANGGFTIGSGGSAVLASTVAANDVCLQLNTGGIPTGGGFSYVQV